MPEAGFRFREAVGGDTNGRLAVDVMTLALAVYKGTGKGSNAAIEALCCGWPETGGF